MSRRSIMTCGAVFALWMMAHRSSVASIPAPAQPGLYTPLVSADSIPPDVFARRILSVADAVIRIHIDPPTRQEMVLAAARGLSTRVGRPMPGGLSERVSSLAAPEDLSQVLAEAFSAATDARAATDAELQAAALDRVCQTIPGRPNIIPHQELRVREQLSANRYVGIGIQLGMDSEKKFSSIIHPFPGGAARKAGAKPGDLILDVDGLSTEGKSLTEVVQMLLGAAGTQVQVTVRQPNSEQKRLLDMTRAEIPIESVLGYRRLPDDSWDFRIDPAVPVAYLRIVSVTASTPHELRRAARSIAASDPKGLVLDLRNHVGVGTLEHFQFVADELMDGPIGRVRELDGQTREFTAGPDSLFKIPIVVLTNQHTRGDPEFLAAALQDAGLATVVGEPTAGDAYIRRLAPLPDGLGAIVLRAAVWERPSGKALLGSDLPADEEAETHRRQHADRPGGVRPNHIVPQSDEQRQRWISWRRNQDIGVDSAGDDHQAESDLQLDTAVQFLNENTGN